MQKIDFVKSIEIIVSDLDSATIVNILDTGFNNPSNLYNYQTINQFLFQSKSNYDRIKNDEQIAKILGNLNAESLYSQQNLASLTNIFRAAKADFIIGQPSALAFYLFHRALLINLKLVKEVLLTEILNEDANASLNNGVILFHVIIDGEGLETEKYIKIFGAINELVETIAKIQQEANQKSEIILLDSGSDTNIGVKAAVETAKSLFLVFKEIWDFIINFRHYKQGVTNKTILESLTIRQEIKKKVDAGILTEDEAKEYVHLIKSRTDDLIGMKVMPKQIVIESTEIQNKKLLSDFEGYKMLGQGD